MKSLKGSLIAICTLGTYVMGTAVYANSDPVDKQDKKENSLTSSFLSFFDSDKEEKNIGEEILLLEKPTKANAGKYITLSEPASSLNPFEEKKKITVKQSFAVKPSLIFNMGTTGFSASSPSGFSGIGASTHGQQVTFSYGRSNAEADQNALGLSFGSQFLSEPSSIMSPLFDGSEFDQVNNRQVYNLSVDMGYAGFKLGASFSQEKMLNDPGLKGFDVGVGYSSNKWGADLKFGEYKRERDRLFASTEEFYDTVYALEIGAAYQLYSNIRFTGRFTYYAYGQENEIDQLRNSQVFFLGTNVNF